jgi:anti-sigma factor RsiW
MMPRHPRPDASTHPSHDLDDLITRHLDGGLDPVEQRRLAALLAGSPAAREMLARYLRLEAGLIRLASTTAGDETIHAAVAVMPRTKDRMGWPRRRPQAAAAVFAGGLAVAVGLAVVVAVLCSGMRSASPGSGDVAVIADRWLELRTADASGPNASLVVTAGIPGEDVQAEPGGVEPPDDDPAWRSDAPPAWMVIAAADQRAHRSAPDEG